MISRTGGLSLNAGSSLLSSMCVPPAERKFDRVREDGELSQNSSPHWLSAIVGDFLTYLRACVIPSKCCPTIHACLFTTSTYVLFCYLTPYCNRTRSIRWRRSRLPSRISPWTYLSSYFPTYLRAASLHFAAHARRFNNQRYDLTQHIGALPLVVLSESPTSR